MTSLKYLISKWTHFNTTDYETFEIPTDEQQVGNLFCESEKNKLKRRNMGNSVWSRGLVFQHSERMDVIPCSIDYRGIYNEELFKKSYN